MRCAEKKTRWAWQGSNRRVRLKLRVAISVERNRNRKWPAGSVRRSCFQETTTECIGEFLPLTVELRLYLLRNGQQQCNVPLPIAPVFAQPIQHPQHFGGIDKLRRRCHGPLFEARFLRQPDKPQPSFSVFFRLDDVVVRERRLNVILAGLKAIPSTAQGGHRCTPEMRPQLKHDERGVSPFCDSNEP